MSEATEVPMVCEDCGGTLTDDDAIWSWSPSCFSHINYSQCFSSLDERLTLATQRAEAAEAERDDIIAICRGTQLDDAAIHSMREYVTEKLRIEAERNALRKDAEMLREAIDTFISFQGSTRELEGQAALTAALAVQPTTGDTNE